MGRRVCNTATHAGIVSALLLAGAVLIILPFSAFPQGRTSMISGTVLDESGSAVAGATIIIRKSDTGTVRTLSANEGGLYHAAFLEPGTYEVTATRKGFRDSTSQPFVLELDRESVVNHILRIGEVSESVEVHDVPAIVDTSPSSATSLVDGRTIVDLPLNGRDYLQLATLATGTINARARVRNVNTGYGVQLSVSGSRPMQNNFRLDGISLTNYTSSTPGSVLGVNLGVDSIREFSLLSNTYGAQYGRAAGGVINAVTRSGSNDLHGTAFYVHRNDNLDARNFFDPSAPPEFRRHQFGGSVGGPIVRNKTFVFLNYEELREDRGSTTIDTTLSDAAREGRLQAGTVIVDPSVARFLELYPRPNGEVLGDTALFAFSNYLIAREHFGTVRLDHDFRAADRLFVRYVADDAVRDNQTDFMIADQGDSTRTQSVALEETHVFTPQLLATFRLGFARSLSVRAATQARVAGADNADLAFLPGLSATGTVTVSGLTTFPGGSGAQDSDRDIFNSYQMYSDWNWARGRHWLSFGGAPERMQFNIDSRTLANGDYRFKSISDFLTNKPDLFRAQLPGSDTYRGFRQWLFGWYVQDRVKVTSRFTLDLGIRHEFITVPTEVHGKISNLDQLTSPAMRLGDPLFDNPSLANVAPRIGFAWDLFGNGETVIRSGYGIFYDQLLSQFLLSLGLRNPPFYSGATVQTLAQGDFPKNGYYQLINRPNLDLRTERIPRDVGQPYVQQWSFSVQQALGADTILRLTYAGSRGVHLSTIVEDANLAASVVLPDGRLYFPAGGQKQNPNFGMIRDREFNGDSFYEGLQVHLERHWRQGIRFMTSYTFAKSVDDDSSTYTRSDSSNAIGIPMYGDHKFNRGLSDHDVRHNFVLSGLWEVPSPPGAVSHAALGGWRLGSIVTVSSGLPFSAVVGYDAARTKTTRVDTRGGQRPDLRPGAGNNPVTGNPDRWFDPSAFQRPVDGFFGNLGRNTMTGPGLATVDLSVTRQFRLGRRAEGAHLEFRAEGFNALNHTNFDLPDPTRLQVFTRTSTPEDVGRITSAAPSREIQLGLKLIF